MEAKFSLILSDEFLEFCKLNNIENVQAYAKEIFDIGFNFKKYGTKPITKKESQPSVIKNKEVKIEEKHKKLYDE